ncbi:tripartite tricarboxylate transporter TctB family protein [Alloalcanivorax sp. C16-1]|uniref:tripartite tricarboxylate transporter TctB family protein n=1 Tax=Alloalcanivorax sp. C16-1 TaxID=3390051 RepID=UPI003970DBD8
MTQPTDTQGQEESQPLSPVVDLGVAILFGVICAAGWFSVLSGKRLMASLDSGLDPGAAFLPVVVLGLLSLGTVLILIKGLYRLAKHGRGGRSIEHGDHGSAVALLVSMILLGGGVAVIGFLPATFIFSTAWTAWLSWRRTGRPLRAAIVGLILGVALCLFLYVTFVSILKVPLA